MFFTTSGTPSAVHVSIIFPTREPDIILLLPFLPQRHKTFLGQHVLPCAVQTSGHELVFCTRPFLLQICTVPNQSFLSKPPWAFPSTGSTCGYMQDLLTIWIARVLSCERLKRKAKMESHIGVVSRASPERETWNLINKTTAPPFLSSSLQSSINCIHISLATTSPLPSQLPCNQRVPLPSLTSHQHSYIIVFAYFFQNFNSAFYHHACRTSHKQLVWQQHFKTQESQGKTRIPRWRIPTCDELSRSLR